LVSEVLIVEDTDLSEGVEEIATAIGSNYSLKSLNLGMIVVRSYS
jgi:hypothetical protein